MLANILEECSAQNSLKVLQLSRMNLEHHSIIGYLRDMISTVEISELDLSFARISLKSFNEIIIALKEKELENV